MPDERPAPGHDEARPKVTDRRRFTPEGEPVADGPASSGPVADEGRPGGGDAAARASADAAGPRDAPDPRAAPDPRDARIAEQAARIDELARAYAALVEDNKAYRQRLDRERARVIEAERASVAQALLEAADDLERALSAVAGGDGAHAALIEGVRLSLGGLQARIARLGAERIPVEGRPFDPHLAEAIDTVAVADEARDGLVLQEVRAGWRIGERVLRPARVRVGRLARA